MTTAILLPTLNRPHRVAEVCADIHANTGLPHRIYWCASDPDSVRILHELGEWVLDDSEDPDKRYVTRNNKMAALLGDEDFLFFDSDDVRHHPGWLEEAIAALDTQPGAEVVITNDLCNPNGTQALMRRSYLDRAVVGHPGKVFFGGYIHNFADTEQFYTAARRGVLTTAPRSVVEHLHPVFQGPNALPWDATYEGSMHGWAHDETLFTRRLAIINAEIPA